MANKDATETLAADSDGIAKAARVLREGGLVAVPTETVYGLAARADSAAAVARIYEAKGRPSFNPLIVHVRSQADAERYAEFAPEAAELAHHHWPGPLTLVLPKRAEARLAAAVTAGLPTVALRCPQHPVMQALLDRCAFPLAAPSANPSGQVSPTRADHVQALAGRIDLILDDGEVARRGIESTIVAVRADGSLETLRPGPIDLEHASSLSTQAVSVEAPGQTTSHYSPGKPLRLNAREVAPDDFVIGFGPMTADCNLSPFGDLQEAAARLYACLHEAAASPKPSVAVAEIPDEGLGAAINDRLRRAAAPRQSSSGS